VNAAPGQQDVFLAPGEHFVGDRRHRVHTLLGSCVSITLWHARWRVGAMSHFLLAQRGGQPGQQGEGAEALDARYGAEALALMLRDLAALGVAADGCEAKIFGGADMFPAQPHTLQVGRRNGDAAHALLAAHGIRVVSHSLFGTTHRRIVFDIASGDVWARQADAAPAAPPTSSFMPLQTPAGTR
jgi:chemotaxis protein CheD